MADWSYSAPAHDDTLTAEQLAELTGARQVASQERILTAARIHYFKAADGKLRTTWTWVHESSGATAARKAQDDAPNFDAIGNGA